jgi:hypothetical protein
MRHILCLLLVVCAHAQIGVVTYHNDLARSGENLQETVLTPETVTPQHFGKLFAQAVDGQVYAQPLYLPEVTVPGKGAHNIVFVATEHNSVYAFDADSAAGSNSQPIWHVNLTPEGSGESTISTAAAMNCQTITPEIGITSTPVIDPETLTLYVVAATNRGESYYHRLHALDATTGAERPGSPVIMQASVAGTGGDFFSPSPVTFLPYFQMSRAGLVLVNGVVYIGWSSYCDERSYHGWILGFDAQSLQPVAAFNSTPNANQGSIWMGGAAPAADSAGNLYAITANGHFDGKTDFGDSILKIATPGLTLLDTFTPFNESYLDRADIDLGSGGTVLLPDAAGSSAHPRLLAAAGKEGRIYLIDRDRMGGHHAQDDSQIVQSIEGAIGPQFSVPAYWNGTLYFAASNDPVKAFPIAGAHIAMPSSSQSPAVIGYPGGVPSISANGSTNGIVWVIESGTAGALHAYDAANLANELYNSRANPVRDATGPLIKFSVPTIVNGKVYIGSRGSLVVFGLLN